MKRGTKLLIIFIVIILVIIYSLFEEGYFGFPENFSDITDTKVTAREEYSAINEDLNGGESGVDNQYITIRSNTISPTHSQTAITREIREGEYDVATIVIRDNRTGKERLFFTRPNSSWDITSIPQWLGESYLIFLRHCGTSCQGFMLLNTETGELRGGLLSYMSYDDNLSGSDWTHWKDWFGDTHFIDGIPKHIRTETDENGSVFIIFEMQNASGTPSGTYRFVFDSAKQKLSQF